MFLNVTHCVGDPVPCAWLPNATAAVVSCITGAGGVCTADQIRTAPPAATSTATNAPKARRMFEFKRGLGGVVEVRDDGDAGGRRDQMHLREVGDVDQRRVAARDEHP